MSITFLDPTFPNRIPSRNEVLDFNVVTTDPEALTLSLRYLDGRMETIFQQNLIGALYTVTRDGTGNRSFHVSRRGGWPGNAQPFYFAFSEAPLAGSSTWTPFYDVDLTTIASQTINGGSDVNTFGTFTMDGQPWYWHGASGHVNQVHGQGLVGSVNGTRVGGNLYAGFYVGLRVYLMTGWDPTKDTFCMVQFSGDTTVMTGTGPHVGCGMWSNTETWGYGPGNNAQLTRLYPGFNIEWTDGVYKPEYPKAGGPVEDFANWWLACKAQPFDASYSSRNGRKNGREGLWLRDPTSSAFPDPESFQGLGCENGIGTAQNEQYKMGFFAGTLAGSTTFTATRLRILQRAVT